MDTISELLGGHLFNEPPEIKLIKKFIQDKFEEDCSVKISTHKILIYVPNSALAGALNENLQSLKSQLNTSKVINIIIGKL